MLSMSRSLQDDFDGKNSYKSTSKNIGQVMTSCANGHSKVSKG